MVAQGWGWGRAVGGWCGYRRTARDAHSTRDVQCVDEVVMGKLTSAIKLQRTKCTHAHRQMSTSESGSLNKTGVLHP